MNNDQGGTGKTYTINKVLITLATKHSWSDKHHLKLDTTSKGACLIEEIPYLGTSFVWVFLQAILS